MRNSTPVFLCGHAKSGTTLLRSLLDGHPDLLVFPQETMFLRRVLPRPEKQRVDYALKTGSINRMRQGLVLDRQGYLDYTGFDFAEYETRIRRRWEASDGSARSLLESLVFSYGEMTGQVGRRYWVEKSASNEAFLEGALAQWPDMKAIYIVRDPRDTFCAYGRKRAEASKTLMLEEFIVNWASSVHAWEQFTSGRANGLTICYDRLVQHPRVELERICEFLQIEWDDILLKPTHNGALWAGNSMYGQVYSGISTEALHRYREILSPEETDFLETCDNGAIPVAGRRQTIFPAHSNAWPLKPRKRQPRKQIANDSEIMGIALDHIRPTCAR
jgi:hypothetical protein